MFSFKEIRELIRLIDQSGVTHLEWEKEGERLVIKKETPPGLTAGREEFHFAAPAAGPSGFAGAPPERKAPEGGAPAGGEAQAGGPGPGASAEEEAEIHIITAPMVGTFYEAPSPGAPPFVKVGDRVEPGTVVCIIEAMKLFNEIEAEVSGTIVEVLVQNGTLVEYGQPLFKVRLDG
ncbi:acetyl-CoA carboxylase biotin carboxyl carrier protein [Hydrogenibacillus schlegelii]|uniref:Biotin carboxyl carrier protein of acetyl-CoA carboxylase n=1 Tax=Hydrogenibacillus schlegelii TaxID=1484 RepID=A0A132N8A0_HYDSH|nr:acetyl-CoA carboxylase biotin carboxyl carrier protein [Hydrogenibacillus schlegelii]KWX06333.1 hypothetical protein TR75_06320 [Hydrogenibacillus schlegelii]OAR03237.1 hypothetical protein SA87_04965 [Hydrogenibacillus schlegelii]PTQ53742.1 MAG: Biotin carboxyl carrier protein of acetyl-CoA carboxylase [Hydrogenibacillus schlegelii]